MPPVLVEIGIVIFCGLISAVTVTILWLTFGTFDTEKPKRKSKDDTDLTRDEPTSQR